MSQQKWITTSAGVKMPGILYGTAWKKERTADLVFQAIQAGFRGIDTACQPKHYSEPLVGEGIHRALDEGIRREDLYLQTKFTPLSSQDPEQVPYDKGAPVEVQVAQSFETSKKNLHTDYVDCLILHSPLESHELTMRAWHEMEVILRAGGARQLGVSNFYDHDVLKALYADAHVRPVIVQNRFYKKTKYEMELRQWCKDQGVIFESFWSLTANPQILASDMVKALAEKHQKTESQIFFRYLSLSGIVPLTGTSSEDHMKEDLSIFEFELASHEMDGLDGLLIEEAAKPEPENKT